MRVLQGRAVRRKSRPGGTKRPAPSGSLGMGVGRLEAFSDGVLAIVITLLILDFKVPAAATGHLGHELARMWPHYTAYLLSFVVVGTIWLNHHGVVRCLTRTNHMVQILNLLLLLSVSVLPWPTAVLSDYLREGTRADQRVAVALYGVSLNLMGITFTVLWRYVLRHHELHRPDLDRKALAGRRRRNTVTLVAYPLVTVLGLLSAPLFIALILALAVVYLWPTRDVRSGRRRPRRARGRPSATGSVARPGRGNRLSSQVPSHVIMTRAVMPPTPAGLRRAGQTRSQPRRSLRRSPRPE